MERTDDLEFKASITWFMWVYDGFCGFNTTKMYSKVYVLYLQDALTFSEKSMESFMLLWYNEKVSICSLVVLSLSKTLR